MALELPFSLDDQFVVLREIKAGGFGIVYAGWDENLNLPIALKEIHPELLRQDSALSAFQAEAQLIARLDHPGICRLYTLKRSKGRVFMIMEFIDGGDLRNLQMWMKERGRVLSPQSLLYLVRQVGKALHYAHVRNDPTTGAPLHLVHRDVAPSNFMISRMGSVKLIDFGIARVKGVMRPETMGGIIKGRPQYMSPEQIHSPETLDHRSDIYSLAVVFLDLLTGHSVYGRTTNEYELLDRVRARRFDLPAYFAEHNIPKELREPIEGALQLAVSQRTKTAREFVDQLDAYRSSIGYDEELAHGELRVAAQEAFPPANLQHELERFREARESAATMTIQMPRDLVSPTPTSTPTPPSGTYTGSQRLSREMTPPPVYPPEPRKEKTNWTAWVMGVVVTAVVGLAVWFLFIRQPFDVPKTSTAGVDSAAVAQSKPPENKIVATDTARVNADTTTRAKPDSAIIDAAKTETPEVAAIDPDKIKKLEEKFNRDHTPKEKTEQRDDKQPILKKPGESTTPTTITPPPPVKLAGTVGIVVPIYDSKISVDGGGSRAARGGVPEWFDLPAGSHRVRIESQGNQGCPLIQEITVQAPMSAPKYVYMATGTFAVTGNVSSGTTASITSLSQNVVIASGCSRFEAPINIKLLPGRYQAEITMGGGRKSSETFEITAGQSKQVQLQ